jgi:hypothetical protein
MASDPPELAPEQGYRHVWFCLYCYIGKHICRLHDHFSPPPPQAPSTLTNEERKVFIDAQNEADEKYWAPRYRVRRWALLLAGTSIVVLTSIYTERVYRWAYRRGGVVGNKYFVGDEWVEGGWNTVRKDWILRLALLLVLISPCACFAGFLLSTAYYHKTKRDRRAAKAAEKAREQLKHAATKPDPKLIRVRYEDLSVGSLSSGGGW